MEKEVEKEDEIMAAMMGLLEEKGIQSFSKAMVNHGMHPGRYGMMDRPDGYGKISGSCGDTVEMFLRVRNGKVEEARFMTDGCFFTIAACDTAASMAVGATLADCLKINQDAILKHLEKMPEDHEHCAFLAARTFHRALRDYIIRKKR